MFNNITKDKMVTFPILQGYFSFIKMHDLTKLLVKHFDNYIEFSLFKQSLEIKISALSRCSSYCDAFKERGQGAFFMIPKCGFVSIQLPAVIIPCLPQPSGLSTTSRVESYLVDTLFF